MTKTFVVTDPSRFQHRIEVDAAGRVHGADNVAHHEPPGPNRQRVSMMVQNALITDRLHIAPAGYTIQRVAE